MIPYGKQNISQADINAVVEVLQSDWLTQGPKVPQFESALSRYCGSKFAVAVNSATSALHLACLALGVGENDSVWTTPITFVASANCALYCGATVDFVDIELSSGLMSVDKLAEKLNIAKQAGKLPKVVIPVHLAGQSCDMQGIKALADQYGFAIIEDASHAVGGKYNNRPVGSCEFSDITVFSFHPVKIITSAEGGMALTNCETLTKKMQLLRSHGIVSSIDEMTEKDPPPWYYEQITLGFNYRMTDLQAALGLSQLSQLDTFVAKRNTLAQRYDTAFNDLSLKPLQQSTQCYSAYHLYIVQLGNADVEQHKQTVIALRAANICAHLHYIPVHLQPYYKTLGFNIGDFPHAEMYHQCAITLPLFPELSTEEQDDIIETIKTLI